MSQQAKAAAATSEAAELKSFARPDEVREFPKGRLELIKIGGATIGRAVFEPGWRWASSVQPIAHTKSCEAPHFQYHVAGVLRVKMDDGTELDCKPGDPPLRALAPAVRRLERDPQARVHALGRDHARAVARRLAALAGRPLQR